MLLGLLLGLLLGVLLGVLEMLLVVMPLLDRPLCQTQLPAY